MDKEKTYQVTYKVFGNDKIKKVSFHGKLLYPLYVQLIFDRKNTVYKCNLFDLFLKPKYGIRVAGELFPPSIDEVIKREEKLVEFIIDKHPDDFSFELFKREYDYYSRDLLDEMEPGFLDYLHTFLQDEGNPYLADTLYVREWPCHLGDVVSDLKRVLKPDIYSRLVEHSLAYAPPYLPLFQYLDSNPRRSLISLIVKDWEGVVKSEQFVEFMNTRFPDRSVFSIVNELEMIVKWKKP